MWRRLESFWPNSMIGSRCSIGNLRTITSHLVWGRQHESSRPEGPAQRDLAKSLDVPIGRTNRVSSKCVRSRPMPRVMRLDPVGANCAVTVAWALKQGQRSTFVLPGSCASPAFTAAHLDSDAGEDGPIPGLSRTYRQVQFGTEVPPCYIRRRLRRSLLPERGRRPWKPSPAGAPPARGPLPELSWAPRSAPRSAERGSAERP